MLFYRLLRTWEANDKIWIGDFDLKYEYYLAVALIIVDVCISVNFFIQRCPATILHTSNGKYVCLCS